MYSIDTSIPGFTSKEKLLYLAELASNVKCSGWIVEIGCYVGRSTYAIGMNKDPSVLLTCIDPWPKKQYGGRPYHKDILGSAPEGEEYNYETWQKYTRDITSIESLRAWTPFTIKSFDIVRKADLIFLDGGHTEEETLQNIKYWFSKLEDGGKLVIDDYKNPLHTGVESAVKLSKNYLSNAKYNEHQTLDIIEIIKYV